MSGHFPIRCFSCRKVINHLYEKYQYQTMVLQENPQTALDSLKIQRKCCRTIFMTHLDSSESLLSYPNFEEMGNKTYPDRLYWVQRKPYKDGDPLPEPIFLTKTLRYKGEKTTHNSKRKSARNDGDFVEDFKEKCRTKSVGKEEDFDE